MNAAVWTLWLVTFSTTAGSPVVAPLAAYTTHDDCLGAYNSIITDLHKAYTTATPSPGILMCVYGMPVKR